MIEKRGNVEYEVFLEDREGKRFPEVVHQGVTYVVCKAGQEFTVQTCFKGASHEKYMAVLDVDGKNAGYRMSLDESIPVMFRGWWIDHKTKKAFVFSAPKTIHEEADFLHSSADNPSTGTIKVTFQEREEYLCPALAGHDCYQCNFLGLGTKTITTAAPEEAGSIKQIEGKKFFLQPSLGAKSGTVLTERPFIKKRFHDRGKARGPNNHTMQLRFETAPILQLRKILAPSNPDHAKLIQADLNDRQGVATGPTAGTDERVVGAKPSESPQTAKVKKETKAVKKERRQGTPKVATIETVDLTEDANDDQDCMMYTVAKRPKREPGVLLHLD